MSNDETVPKVAWTRTSFVTKEKPLATESKHRFRGRNDDRFSTKNQRYAARWLAKRIIDNHLSGCEGKGQGKVLRQEKNVFLHEAKR